MRHFIHCLFVLTLVLSLSQQTMAQNRVAVDKDGKIHRTLSKKNSQGTVDLSKILKPEREKTKKQTPKTTTSKTTTKKQESKPENKVEEKRPLPAILMLQVAQMTTPMAITMKRMLRQWSSISSMLLSTR